jgi:hypothetical protein
MHLQRLIRRLVFLLIFGGVLLYSGFALRNALRGPHVTIASIPSPVTEPVVTISGTAVRAEMVTINSLSIPLTTEGAFGFTTALVEGDNTFIVEASDRFGSTYQERIHVRHVPQSEPVPEAAETTETPVIDNP